MTGWIVTISKDFPHHWEIAKANGLWDFTRRRAIRNDDDVFFWLTGPGGGLLGHTRATSDVIELTSSADRPWDPADGAIYTHRFTFDLLDDHPVRQLTWSELGLVIHSRAYASNGIVKIASEDRVRALSAHFGPATVDVTWPTSLQVGWELAVGETLPRRDVHAKFGGSRQSGIAPSSTSPNVLVFTNPAKGEKFGYNFDGWHADGTFHYTGEGKVGDQRFRAGNKAIRDHKRDGQALRVFESSGTSTTYVGEFRTAEPAYELADAADLNGDLRSVIVFRLEQVNGLAAEPVAAEPMPTPGVVDLPVEANLAETYAATANGEPAERRRAEGGLVNRYAAWLQQQGHDVCRKQVVPPGELQPLYNDLFNITANELVEAKGSIVREAVRMAVGQVLDYARHVPHASRGVLLPSRPREDLVALVLSADMSCIWESDSGTFDRIDP
jgi:hypothetical protein